MIHPKHIVLAAAITALILGFFLLIPKAKGGEVAVSKWGNTTIYRWEAPQKLYRYKIVNEEGVNWGYGFEDANGTTHIVNEFYDRYMVGKIAVIQGIKVAEWEVVKKKSSYISAK